MAREVEVLGLDSMIRHLERHGGREFPKRLQTGLPKGAQKLVKPIRDELNRSIAGHGERPGRLARSVRVRRGRRDRPAVVVGPGTPYRHLVIRGTRPHEIRAKDGGSLVFGGRHVEVIHHPGARANPFADRATRNGTAIVQLAILEELNRE